MKNHLFPGIFLILFLGSACLVTLSLMNVVFSATGAPQGDDLIKGVWFSQFEKKLNENLPIYTSSRNLWGRAEYSLFHQGRKGVVVGADGWLYTDEEFLCPAGTANLIKNNFSYIKDVRHTLEKAGVPLAVVLVPAKSRVLSEHLGQNMVPLCRETIYADALAFLQAEKIPAANVYAAMMGRPDKDTLYLKTDTHWTPAGAMLAAGVLRDSIPPLPQTKKDFLTKPVETKTHDGDLMRYIPGVGAPGVTPDTIEISSTAAADETSGDLFSDEKPPVTLVGTSYSANKLWNFEGFLKESLKADVLNVADEGQGPFTVMAAYLESKEWKESPPKLVIWEIPERYLTTVPEFPKAAK